MTKKRIFFILIILAIIAAIIVIRKHKNVVPPATVTVTTGNIVETAQAVGYIKPSQYSTIKSAVSGIVEEIYHHEGDFVKAGEALLRVKMAPSPEEYAVAYKNVNDADKRMAIAKRDLDRYQILLQKKIITADFADYLIAQKIYATTKLEYELAKQKLSLLEEGKMRVANKNIETTVTSPIDGFILTKAVNVGDAVISLSSAQSATPLLTMADMKNLMFEGSVDEIDVAKIKHGMPATITIGAFSKEKILGTLDLVSLQSENENVAQNIARTDPNSPFNIGFKVKITNLKFPANLPLRSGFSATATIDIRTHQNILLLPTRVLHFAGDKAYVLLPPQNAKQPPEKRYITTGASDGINIEIKNGLKAGDQVLDNTVVAAAPSS